MTPDPRAFFFRFRPCILSILLVLTTALWGRAEHLEFLYVNANVGAAAGGHTALRLGDDVFHYQFYPDKRFLLVREPWDQFKLIYTRLRNRTVFSALCVVDSAAYKKINNHFVTLLASQSYDFYRETVIKEQQAMLNDLAEGRLTLRVRGLGFFDKEKGTSPSGLKLRAVVAVRLGEGFFAGEREKIAAKREALLATLGSGLQDPDILLETLLELGDIKKSLAAIQVLEEGTGLYDSMLLQRPDGKKLSPEDLETLEEYLALQQQRLVDLLGSTRPDRGEALLLQMGRCAAIMASIDNGALVTLDPYPDDAAQKDVDPADLEMRPYMVDLKSLYDHQIDTLLLQLATAGDSSKSDLIYSMLENVQGKMYELWAGLESGRAVRVSARHMVPSRSAQVSQAIPSTSSGYMVLSQSLLKQQQDYEQTLAHKYHYRLITRNCVNLLLKTINDSFSDPAEVEKALGSWIDPVASGVVIPFDLFNRVAEQYRVTEVTRYPSRRLSDVTLLARTVEQPGLWLREGNTLTSTLYSSKSEDTPFLFFTDDVVWARPLLGLANFTWAGVYSVAGVFPLLVGDVDPLHQGLRGMFYSMPELVFANIRKGTYLYEDLTLSESRL